MAKIKFLIMMHLTFILLSHQKDVIVNEDKKLIDIANKLKIKAFSIEEL